MTCPCFGPYLKKNDENLFLDNWGNLNTNCDIRNHFNYFMY